MGNICIVLGGRRSGKSDYAQALGEKLPGRRVFIATCPVLDDEMSMRIKKHQDARKASNWETVEEPLNLASAILDATVYPVVLIDCLTIWINNLMYEAQKIDVAISEELIQEKCRELITSCRTHSGSTIMVTNETGMGIVPDNEQARLFLDLVGRCNQIMCGDADHIALVVSGQPLIIKRGPF
ncbi:MAG: bifunctional adenosylcobinamide kinase/adenosylcobinamide-phosphate guanylyltransferase [Pseudomonadota bacterium]